MTDRLSGVTNLDITPDVAVRVGVVLADRLAKGRQVPPVVGVGHDTRHGAEIIARAAAAGLASGGAKVEFFGCVPGGALSLNVSKNELDGGLMITGGSLPPDRIALLPMAADGSAATPEVLQDLDRRLAAYDDRRRRISAEEIGAVEEAFHPFEFYVSELVQQVDARRIKSKAYRVLIDPANGPASLVAKELFEWVGCSVEMLHFDPNPVPDRPADCSAESCTAAIEKTASLHCDLGLCTDPAAERALFITPEGMPLPAETVGAIFASAVLKRGDGWIASGTAAEAAARRIGAILQPCAAGPAAMAEKLAETGAAFASDGTGRYIFVAQRRWSDGLASGLHLLDLMARRGESLADLAGMAR